MRLSLVRCCISPSSTALFAHPDLLPSTNWGRRNELCERLVRRDMYERRAQIVIPEFYVGSILAVSMSDLHAPGRSNRFLGICIRREREGLFHKFTLRNVIDGLGVEVLYDMYNPCVQKIEVMRLERRLDADLSYLIDALPEYSTFDVNMEPIFHLAGTPVPVNDLKVKLKDPPWSRRWEMFDVNGIADIWTLVTPYYKRKTLKTKLQPWLKYDLIRDYRNSHWAEDEQLIMEEKQRFEVMKQEQKDGAVGVKSG